MQPGRRLARSPFEAMAPRPSPLSPPYLAVALDGVGWHPAAWREVEVDARDVFGPRYWVGLIQEAEWAGLDFVTIEDSLLLQSTSTKHPEGRTDRVLGRLDAVLVAARVAPETARVGIIPVATTTHTEAFHISKAIATLDYVSRGRAGFQARISPTALEAAQFGRRSIGDPVSAGAEVPGLMDEAADFIEVVRRLWDSWEDDAEIRDVATGRFVDRDKLHYIDFEGPWFSVRGPSITPRPPQGQPIVSVLAHVDAAFRLAARSADVVFVTPQSSDDARSLVEEIRSHEEAVGRVGPPLRVIADLVVFLDDEPGHALARKERLDRLNGRPLRSDAPIFAGTPAELVDLLAEWQSVGIEGYRLRPGAIPRDFDAIAHEVVAELADRSLRPPSYQESTLRARFGLLRPANRYASV
jgi:alkanesulfonate monooxygenase SsuD/methylene tetrahydromethanopterin reductase-like flavin-dependent oxidoreductase (luciferase family)